MYSKAKRPIALIATLTALLAIAVSAPTVTNIPKEQKLVAGTVALSADRSAIEEVRAEQRRLAAEEAARIEAANREAEAQRLAQAARARASRQKAVRSPVAAISGAPSDLVDRLAMCESGMRPDAVSRSGKFFGAFQFMLSTWQKFRSGNPINYSYAEQKAVIMQFFPVSSWRSQFPACARKLGVA